MEGVTWSPVSKVSGGRPGIIDGTSSTTLAAGGTTVVELLAAKRAVRESGAFEGSLQAPSDARSVSSVMIACWVVTEGTNSTAHVGGIEPARGTHLPSTQLVPGEQLGVVEHRPRLLLPLPPAPVALEAGLLPAHE